jgi:hypothetical protein
LFTPHEDPLNTEGTWQDITLEPGESRFFEMDIAAADQELLSDGYEIVVNPGPLFLESDQGNNGYYVPYIED